MHERLVPFLRGLTFFLENDIDGTITDGSFSSMP